MVLEPTYSPQLVVFVTKRLENTCQNRLLSYHCLIRYSLLLMDYQGYGDVFTFLSWCCWEIWVLSL